MGSVDRSLRGMVTHVPPQPFPVAPTFGSPSSTCGYESYLQCESFLGKRLSPHLTDKLRMPPRISSPRIDQLDRLIDSIQHRSITVLQVDENTMRGDRCFLYAAGVEAVAGLRIYRGSASFRGSIKASKPGEATCGNCTPESLAPQRNARLPG